MSKLRTGSGNYSSFQTEPLISGEFVLMQCYERDSRLVFIDLLGSQECIRFLFAIIDLGRFVHRLHQN